MPPKNYSGEFEKCSGFLGQCQLLFSRSVPARPPGEDEPMQLGRSRLSPEIHEQLTLLILREGGALHPGLPRSAKRVSSLGRGVLVSRTYTRPPSSDPNKLFPASLAWGLESLEVGALLDSGADECLIDVSLARQFRIPLEPLDTVLSAQVLDGRSLGKITHRTIPLSLTISGNHVESLQFYVLHAPTAPLVLGHTWLDRHDPHVSWSSGRILGWSEACHANCLRSAPSPPGGTKPTFSPSDITGVPSVYHDLAPVFS